MRSLFVRIFLSFWLAQALFVVLAILATMALRPRLDSPRWETLRESVARESVAAYEHGGEGELRQYLQTKMEVFHLRIFFFDSQNRELAGRRVPPPIRDFIEHGPPARSSLAARFLPDRLFVQSVTGASGSTYQLVAEVPPVRHMFAGHEPMTGMGMTIAILTSGLVCFFLARSMTAPVVRLRAATQRLASGDLSARTGASGSRRRDEIAQLLQDFDAMAERIENLVNAQSRLLHDISHELRSPLARLQVALGLAQQRTSVEDSAPLERIGLEADRLNEMIGRLLTLTRLEAGQNAALRSAVALGDLVREVAQDAAYEAQNRKCRVLCEVRAEGSLSGSPSLLRSAIENVVRNAVRYTGEGTAVEVSLAHEAGDGGQAVITVSDRGPGVPEESLEKLFTPFYRIDDARGRESGGVGLGLAITERAVRLHGGSVRARNREGGGLTVEMRLPAAADAAKK